MKRTWIFLLIGFVFIGLLSGCKKDPELPNIVSSDEAVNEDGNVVVEVVYEDESRMYFILLDPTTAAVTNRESFYGEGDHNGYVYRGDVVIPSEITHMGETYTVTTIGEKCFADSRLLKSVHIPHTVTIIESEAFTNSGIRDVIIPNTVDSLGFRAFKNCYGLKSVEIFNSLKKIPSCTFYGCKMLESITLPDSLKYIEDGAFHNCDKLSSIVFPKELKTIGECAFEKCNSLVSLTIPKSVISIGAWAFRDCKKIVELNFNATNCRFDRYFNTDSPWVGCTALETINIGNQVEKISSCAFRDITSTTTVSISESVKVIEWDAFNGCSSLTSITIPNSVLSIGGTRYYEEFNGAFANCSSLTNVSIGNSVDSIGVAAFYKCWNLESINIPNSVRIICSYAFSNCTKLSSISIGSSVEVIGAFAFQNCQDLENVEFPNSVRFIYGGAFRNCHKLTSVIIPESVESMVLASSNGYDSFGAFSNCSGLTTVVCLATMPPVVKRHNQNIRFLSSPNVIYVPAQSVEAYRNDADWSIYSDIIEGL